MFQFTQIQCLYKVTIVYVQSQVSSSYSDFSCDLYILPKKKKNACVISWVFCLSLWEGQRPVSNDTFHSWLSNNPPMFPLFFTHPFSMSSLSLEALFVLSALYLTPAVRFHSDLVWFPVNKHLALHLSPSLINCLFVFLIPWCQRLCFSISLAHKICKSHRALI